MCFCYSCFLTTRFLCGIITQLATNECYVFVESFSTRSSPQRGDMSIENGVFNPRHSSGVLCV